MTNPGQAYPSEHALAVRFICGYPSHIRVDYTMDINNREIASIFWVVIFFVCCFVFSKDRSDLFDTTKNLISAFFSKTIILLCIFLAIYSIFEVYFLWKFGFWEFFLLKETLLWVGSAFGALMVVTRTGTYQDKLRSILINSLTLSVVIEYITNLISFSLIIELILMPLLSFIVIMQVFASYKDEHKQLAKPANIILVFYILFLISYTTYIVIANPEKFNTTNEFKKFITPFLLTVIYMPFPYLFFIYNEHEEIRVVISWSSRDKSVVNAVTIAVVRKFKLNLFALEAWRENAELYRIKSKEDISSVVS